MPKTDGDYTSNPADATVDRPTVVVDRGADHLKKYRTEMPNLLDEMDLDPYEFRLLLHYMRRAGGDGVCNEGLRGAAKACKMAVGTALKTRASLAERGLIEIIPSNSRTRADEIVITDLWAQNMAHFAGVQAANTDVTRVSPDEHPPATGVHVVTQKKASVASPAITPPMVPPLDPAVEDAARIVEKLDRWPGSPEQTRQLLADLLEEFPGRDLSDACWQFVWRVRGGMEVRERWSNALRGFVRNADIIAQKDVQKIVDAPPPSPERGRGARTPRNDSGPKSPQAVVDALANYERPNGGHADLRQFAELARHGWDFTREERPPWPIFSQLGGTDDERSHRLKRIRSLARRALDGEKEMPIAS